jgi:hypothetical protein
VFDSADLTDATYTEDLDGADLSNAKGLPESHPERWILPLVIGAAVLLVAVAIVIRSKGIARVESPFT